MKCKLLLLALMLWTCSLFAQEQKVSGTVAGFFSFQAPKAGNIELEISLVGYGKKLVAVRGTEPLSITIEKEAASLNEVVVIGYGKSKGQVTNGHGLPKS